MTQLVPLAIALGITLVGCLWMWLRHRRPRTMEAHMKEFTRELQALAPDRGQHGKRTTRPVRHEPTAGTRGTSRPGGGLSGTARGRQG
jgi:hypothetical protein